MKEKLEQEGFNSGIQHGLFNSGRADRFLNGLSRAFTLNCAGHTVTNHVVKTNSRGSSVAALFHDDAGNVWEVTVKKGGANGKAA